MSYTATVRQHRDVGQPNFEYASSLQVVSTPLPDAIQLQRYDVASNKFVVCSVGLDYCYPLQVRAGDRQ